MNGSPRPSRPISSLSDSLHYKLNMYALAASAAGIGMLALSKPSEAKIVYTKTHHVIGAHSAYHLDLNHDGTVDFVIQQIGHCNSTTCFGFQRWLLAKEAVGNAVQGSITHSMHYAAALKLDARIGPHQHFISGGYNGEELIYVEEDQDVRIPYTYGKWIDVDNRYLGLKFKIGGEIHYGWARLNAHNQAGLITGTLTGYAYETIPNKPIIAGATKGPNEISIQEPDAALPTPARKPASLGILALGSQGLTIWRREESTAAPQLAMQGF
jgi:hypothetical protein